MSKLEAMDDQERLLEKAESESEYDDLAQAGHQRKRREHRKVLSWIAHVCLIILYTTIFLFAARREREFRNGLESHYVHSPARSALRPEKRVFWSPIFDNPFVGLPRPELDNAWHKLLEPMHIRVSKSELEAANGISLPLADDSGYVGSLEVYHDLHCLKRVRQYIYKDHYYSGVDKALMERYRLHTEHCLEHFRDLVMCRGDIALTTFYYRNHTLTAGLLAEHECVNWQAIENWTRERAIDLSVPGIVVAEEDL